VTAMDGTAQPLDGGVASGDEPPHDSDMEARVAVLEQIAKDTREALVSLRTDLRGDVADLRTEMRGSMTDLRAEMRALRSEQRIDYRWLLGIMLGLGGGLLAAMAKGFHWLG